MKLYIVVNQYESQFGDINTFTFVYSTWEAAQEQIRRLHYEATVDNDVVEDDCFDEENNAWYRTIYYNDEVDDAEIHEAWLDNNYVDESEVWKTRETDNDQ